MSLFNHINKLSFSSVVKSSKILGYDLRYLSIDIFSAAIGARQVFYNEINSEYLIWKICNKNLHRLVLYNGNNISDNNNFDNYLKRLGYKFKNEDQDFGGYIILKNKKICLTMDVGPSPNLAFSKDYQSGALSFEIISNGIKLISNCGYHKESNIKLNEL